MRYATHPIPFNDYRRNWLGVLLTTPVVTILCATLFDEYCQKGNELAASYSNDNLFGVSLDNNGCYPYAMARMFIIMASAQLSVILGLFIYDSVNQCRTEKGQAAPLLQSSLGIKRNENISCFRTYAQPLVTSYIPRTVLAATLGIAVFSLMLWPIAADAFVRTFYQDPYVADAQAGVWGLRLTKIASVLGFFALCNLQLIANYHFISNESEKSKAWGLSSLTRLPLFQSAAKEYSASVAAPAAYSA